MTPISPKSTDTDILSWFRDALVSSAATVGLEAKSNEALASTVFRGGREQAEAQLDPVDLPVKVLGLSVGRYSLLVGQLPNAPSNESIEDTLRRFRNQSVVARSYLSTNDALDLQVFLIGPPGSEDDERWMTLGLLIERDEKVARKLAWLRPVDGGNVLSSYNEFIRRTFLAEPWNHDAVFTMADLDSLSRIPELADGSLPRETAKSWVQLTFKHHDDTVTLVDSLIDAWSKRGKK
jgi:hypothetical protein